MPIRIQYNTQNNTDTPSRTSFEADFLVSGEGALNTLSDVSYGERYRRNLANAIIFVVRVPSFGDNSSRKFRGVCYFYHRCDAVDVVTPKQRNNGQISY